jgi:hypothetical protein
MLAVLKIIGRRQGNPASCRARKRKCKIIKIVVDFRCVLWYIIGVGRERNKTQTEEDKMNTRKIDQAEASKINLTKKYGIMGDGCIGIWGEGDTVDAAMDDAGKNQVEYSGCDKPDFTECEIVVIA